MRKKPTKSTTFEEVFSLAELTSRVKQLEQKIVLFEAEIRGNCPFLSVLPEENADEQTMGRKRKLPEKEVIRRRDDLAHWIEMNWPYLSQKLSKAPNPKFALYGFTKAKEQGAMVMRPVPFYADPERFTEEVWAFIKSKRYGGNPRNLAGAMAGLPELTWKRSLDITQKHFMTTPMHPHAWRDHLRRRFANRFRELRTAQTAEEVQAILKKSKTDDVTYCHMKKYPQEVFDQIVKPGTSEP